MGLFSSLSNIFSGASTATDWLGVADSVAPTLVSLASNTLAERDSARAATVSAGASDNAARTQWSMFNQSRDDLAPYRDAGSGALYQLAALQGVDYSGAPGTTEDRRQTAMARFEASPGYDFRLGEGIKALDRSAAARGRLFSGAQAKGVLEFGQNIAAEEFGANLNRLSSLAGVGQAATGSTATMGAYAANAAGKNTVSAANARASGMMAASNMRTSNLNNLLYMYGT